MSAPSRPIRWGILGTARIARKIAAAIAQIDDVELAGVASRDLSRAKTWAHEHGARRAYGSYEALLTDPDIDAVYIPLPPSMHAEWTIAAADAGKHVLCEKPLAMNGAEAQRMADACAKAGVQLMDGVMWLHHPRTDEMQRAIASGSLGDLRRLTAAFSFHWDPLPLDDFRFRRDLGGGALLDLGWYCVGAALWAFGEPPRRVLADAYEQHGVDLRFSAWMWFRGDRMASFDCAFDTSMRKWLEVAGTRASIVCDDFTRPWKPDKPRFWIHGAEGKASEHVSPAPLQEVCMLRSFGDAIRSGRLRQEWPARAIETQRVCDALLQSARDGRPVAVDETP